MDVVFGVPVQFASYVSEREFELPEFCRHERTCLFLLIWFNLDRFDLSFS